MIEEFKKEHSVIIDTLNKIEKLDICSKEGLDTALSVQKKILTHIKKEDEKLYPVLRRAAKSNRKLEETFYSYQINRGTWELIDRNMGAISDSAFHFFDNYSMKAGNQLTMEIEWLIETLTWRIQREEIFIFTMYENLYKKEVSW